tara:strand:- start:67 stop:1752 length:1686 start_codon:yes stop_codon:yes gene_type:complete
MSGLTPVATITNVEIGGPLGESIESVTVSIEIKDSFSDDFNVTSWFANSSSPTELTDMSKYLTLRVIQSTNEETTNYLTSNDIGGLAAEGLDNLIRMSLGFLSYQDIKVSEYITEAEASYITEYYYSTATAQSEKYSYHIPFEATFDLTPFLESGESNPFVTNHLQYFAYVYWNMEALASDYGLDLATSFFGIARGDQHSLNVLPNDPDELQYDLVDVCGTTNLAIETEVEEAIDESSFFGADLYVADSEPVLHVEGLEKYGTRSIIAALNLRNIIMKNSELGWLFHPDASEAFLSSWYDYFLLRTTVYRTPYNADGDTAIGDPEMILYYSPTSATKHGYVTYGHDVDFQLLDLGFDGVKHMVIDDNEINETIITSGSLTKYGYSISIEVEDSFINFFLDFINTLRDSIEWLRVYLTHCEQSCNFNDINNRFNDFFIEYLGHAYERFEYFEVLLNGHIDNAIDAVKILSCITDTQATELKSLLYRRLHPHTARPKTIAKTIEHIESYETTIADILGREPIAAEGYAAGATYGSGNTSSSTFTIEKDWGALDNINFDDTASY